MCFSSLRIANLLTSRQAIKKYILANNDLGNVTETTINMHISKALQSGEEGGDFLRPKGASGPVKLAKKDGKKPAVTATPAKTETKAKAAPAKVCTHCRFTYMLL